MEERNRNKRFRIESVYYESSMLEPRDDYSQEQYEEIADLLNMNNSKSARNLVSRALEHIRNEESGIFILLFLYNQPNFAADILIL